MKGSTLPMDNNYDVLAYVSSHKGVPSVLATIINVEGSAYRKEGAMMLIKNSGESIGVLSVGCLEVELAEHAKLMLKANDKAKIIKFDLSSEDDLGWGRGAGCNGKIMILLEKIDDTLRSQFKMVEKLLNEGLKVMAVKNICFKTHSVATMYKVENGESFGDPFKGNTNWLQCIPNKNSLVKGLYFHHFQPKNRLFIFGAGTDARPVATLATKLYYNVFVWDWRPKNLKSKYFPNVEMLQPSFPWKNVDMTKNDFIIIMTHDFQKDQQLLHHFMTFKQIKYLGILGPRKRTKRLLNGKNIPSAVNSPIGLPIGADGPREIAISILAELIKRRQEKNSERPDWITDRNFLSAMKNAKSYSVKGAYYQ